MTAKWGHINAKEILPPIRGKLISGHLESVIYGLNTDSREIVPGQLFWALKGERYDGHDYIKQAVEKGAIAIVIQNDCIHKIPPDRNLVVITVTDTLKALGDLAGWWRHQHTARVAAITGSVGKTTTKDMAAGIMGLGGMTLKNKGNLNNLIGLPLTLLSLEQGHSRAVLEMGMNRPGEIGRLTEIASPDIGIITNVAKVHLEGLGDIKGVARAKAELMEKVSDDSQVVLNGDDELLMGEASRFSRKVITYGLGSKNNIRAEEIHRLGREGISFKLHYYGHPVAIKLKVPGIQNVYNAMAASAIAICLKERPDHIIDGLQNFKGIGGRFTMITLPCGVTLIDDTYNSNPSSLKAAFDTVKECVVDEGRLIVGLGEMMELGDETVSAHSEAGTMVAELGAHYFLALGEHAPEMRAGALSHGLPDNKIMVVDTHEEMAQQIRGLMKKGDLILLKGSRKMHLEKVVESLVEGYG
ncbi:MAG: UDP-N-acetylmuramoyl-tripeptide--D-alanyl-D-alanine ligase [Thermodesulfobacteriota bacterium]|nr:UDP-N-acetylmuramoyl-tripeptide--D-alanyl-D-alanine ligase [Thermodesulfobacteriota bacterium]